MKETEVFAVKTFLNSYPKNRYANFRYMLLEDEKEMKNADQVTKVKCFGAEIIREDLDGDCIYARESDRIECITPYRYKAVQLLKKLFDGCVSPIHLIDIAGPIVDEWVSDFDLEQASVQNYI